MEQILIPMLNWVSRGKTTGLRIDGVRHALTCPALGVL